RGVWKSSQNLRLNGLLSAVWLENKGWGGRRAAPPWGSGSDPDRYGPRPSYSRGRQRQNLPAITVNRDIDRHGENMRLPLNGMIIVGRSERNYLRLSVHRKCDVDKG